MDETLKVVWAYMIEHGTLTNGKWSYYGGSWESPRPGSWEWGNIDAAEKAFKEEVKSIGVNWGQTKEPESSTEYAFTDTFHDSESVETLLGKLVLNNGKEYLVGVSNADVRFSTYMKMIAQLAADKQRVKDIFGE
jgi:hypothetical protein